MQEYRNSGLHTGAQNPYIQECEERSTSPKGSMKKNQTVTGQRRNIQGDIIWR